jgi:hypothetical protein
MRPRPAILLASVGIVLLTLIPYAIVCADAGDSHFTGFLFNPYDSASYLAKMRQGEEGQWLYTLAFSESPGSGALIFPYYLFLGHAARLLNMPLVFTWHMARLLGGLLFLIAAWECFGRVGLSRHSRIIAWILAALGAGFGFAAIAFGGFTADLWVAEYLPVLGMLTSAHFPLATALILFLAMQIALPARRPSLSSLALIFLLATLLGAVQPFGFLPLGAALAAWMIWVRIDSGIFPEGSVAGLAAAGLGILPWAVYDLWIILSLPAFASWFSQNLTPTPPVWDLVLSLGLPGLIAAVSFVRFLMNPGPFRAKLRSVSQARLLLGLWFAINLLLLYAPFPLQRRLMLGMWIPLAALAAPTINAWLFRPAISLGRALTVCVLVFLTSSIFIFILLTAGLTRNPLLFLTPDEAAAVDWLEINAQGSVVLAEPEMSLWLPGMAGVRVVYGHPMETPYASQSLADTEEFFLPADGETQLRILIDHDVDWVACDAAQGACDALEGTVLDQVFASGSIRIFTVRKE